MDDKLNNWYHQFKQDIYSLRVVVFGCGEILIDVSLAFVREFTGDIWQVNSPHKESVTRKMVLFDDVMMLNNYFPDIGTISRLSQYQSYNREKYY